MNLLSFLFGAIGALLTVYLAKQDAIPEFRLIFDTLDTDKEVMHYQDQVRKTEKSFNEIQRELQEGIKREKLGNLAILTTDLETIQRKLSEERSMLQSLEDKLDHNRNSSRIWGAVFYILLGGFFGAMLAGRVKIDGVSGELPNYLQAIVIGATWITYLSVLGLRTAQAKADNLMEAGKKEAADLFDTFQKNITSRVENIVSGAEQADKVNSFMLAAQLHKILNEELDDLIETTQNNWDRTRQMVGKHAKGVL